VRESKEALEGDLKSQIFENLNHIKKRNTSAQRKATLKGTKVSVSKES
jgi:hypothetical protein